MLITLLISPRHFDAAAIDATIEMPLRHYATLFYLLAYIAIMLAAAMLRLPLRCRCR